MTKSLLVIGNDAPQARGASLLLIEFLDELQALCQRLMISNRTLLCSRLHALDVDEAINAWCRVCRCCLPSGARHLGCASELLSSEVDLSIQVLWLDLMLDIHRSGHFARLGCAVHHAKPQPCSKAQPTATPVVTLISKAVWQSWRPQAAMEHRSSESHEHQKLPRQFLLGSANQPSKALQQGAVIDAQVGALPTAKDSAPRAQQRSMRPARCHC